MSQNSVEMLFWRGVLGISFKRSSSADTDILERSCSTEISQEIFLEMMYNTHGIVLKMISHIKSQTIQSNMIREKLHLFIYSLLLYSPYMMK